MTGTSVDVDGTAARVELNLDAIALGGAMTIESIVKYHAWTSYGRVLECSTAANGDNDFSLGHGSETGQLSLVVKKSGITKGCYGTVSHMALNTWTHIVGTVSGTEMKVYKNGVLLHTRTTGHEPNVMLRANCYVGEGLGDTMDGEVRTLKIYTRALTDAEVLEQFNLADTSETSAPTRSPTAEPTSAPTSPTAAPTDVPTSAPTPPTSAPSMSPTTSVPTQVPSAAPSTAPSAAPSTAPSAAPSHAPSQSPSVAPSQAPTAGVYIIMKNSHARFFIGGASITPYPHRQYETLCSHLLV